jgi:hypothetical protein
MGEDNPHIGGDENMVDGELLLDYDDENLYGLNLNMRNNPNLEYSENNNMNRGYGNYMSDVTDKFETYEQEIAYQDLSDMASEYGFTLSLCHADKTEDPEESTIYFDIKDGSKKLLKARINSIGSLEIGTMRGRHFIGEPVDSLSDFDETFDEEGKLKDMGPAPAKQPEKPDRGTETVPGTPTKTPDKDRPSRRPFNPPPHITPGEEPGPKARGRRSYMSYMGDEDKTSKPSHDKPQRPGRNPFEKPMGDEDKTSKPSHPKPRRPGRNPFEKPQRPDSNPFKRPNNNEGDVKFS